MYQTKNDLSEQSRKRVIELLSARLADCIDLQLQAKQAHWNVKDRGIDKQLWFVEAHLHGN